MAPEVGRVSIGSISLSLARHGSHTGPPVVMLPGPTDSWRSYRPVLERLVPSVHAIAVSARGHGDSDKPADGYRIEDFATDVEAVLDALGIERAVLVGHSGSCPVARRVAIERPDRVAGLLLEASPTTLHGNAGLQAFVDSVVADLRDPIDADLARSFVSDTATDTLAPAFVDELVGELRKVPARVWREMFTALLGYDDTAELGRIRAPTCLIWGDADRIVGRAMQDALLAGIPGSELVVYPGVGHTPRWEDPARFAADLGAFVRRVAPGDRAD
jgi:pimeloyl-ACP methyl ester carboxylesterase